MSREQYSNDAPRSYARRQQEERRLIDHDDEMDPEVELEFE